jgi:indole-3-glycerol phosphate synthase
MGNLMNSFLDNIVAHKRQDIAELYDDEDLVEALEAAPAYTTPFKGRFHKALSQMGLSLIAEVKKASPSKGIIRPDFDPIVLAQTFEKEGAKALSVLTEVGSFLGDPRYIAAIKKTVQLPILRKDFILDPIQVIETKQIQADAMLLIKALLSVQECEKLLHLAHSLEMDVVIEVHNEKELESVLAWHPPIIGINNRNLSTFATDLSTVDRLSDIIRKYSPSSLIVAESGYSSGKELEGLRRNGIDAVLIGEGLARHPDILKFFHTVI